MAGRRIRALNILLPARWAKKHKHFFRHLYMTLLFHYTLLNTTRLHLPAIVCFNPGRLKVALVVLGLLGVAAFFNRQAKKKQAA